MARYAIGDVQGCLAQLQALLKIIEFSPSRDQLYLLGDLVNRGPDSAGVLRWARDLEGVVFPILGNHDLHLLAIAAGCAKVQSDDTSPDVLKEKDGRDLIAWLRRQPLFRQVDGFAMVHAGLLPQWTIAKAQALSDELSAQLSGKDSDALLARLYGNKPTRWRDDLTGADRMRVIVNAMTRMRFLTQSGDIDLNFKGNLRNVPAELLPWFEAKNRRWQGTTVLCGHWSALGLYMSPEVCAIDTGCLWGGHLTALRLSDRHIFQLACPETRRAAC